MSTVREIQSCIERAEGDVRVLKRVKRVLEGKPAEVVTKTKPKAKPKAQESTSGGAIPPAIQEAIDKAVGGATEVSGKGV